MPGIERIYAAWHGHNICPRAGRPFGRRAADLQFEPLVHDPDFALPDTRLKLALPAEPRYFVDRLLSLSRASQVLAPDSEQSGVLFYGMAGSGKTACALELAYRHERDRRQRSSGTTVAPAALPEITTADSGESLPAP